MLEFRSPLLNATGSLGFAPSAAVPFRADLLGAFVTNPISYRPRKSSISAQQQSYAGGMLLHSGHPNPGLSASIKRYADKWAHAKVPIIIHLLADDAQELSKAVQRVEEMENLLAIEIGLDSKASRALASELCSAARGELPFIVQLPLERAAEFAPLALDAGAAALGLGPPRGSLPSQGKELLSGRLYGPSIFPLALNMVETLYASGFPVIGAGGIYAKEQAQTMLQAGALAVQLDTVLWKTDTELSEWLPL